jgi:F-type H+-transporting ATPase subunit b
MFKFFKKIEIGNKKFKTNYLFLFFIASITIFNFNLAKAASDAPPFSLSNTDFVVAISFCIFIGVLVYFKVPRIIVNLLDKRSNAIRKEIDDANKLLEEAKSLLAKSEREHKDNILKAKEIISSAENTSKMLLEDSKSDIKLLVSRKLDMAKKQIEANEKKVLNSVRDEIIDLAFKLAEDDINKRLDKNTSNQVTKESINEIGSKLL